MNLWWILFVFDGLLFAFVALTVVYLLVFSIASLFGHKPELLASKHINRFIVLIPSYQNDNSILQTVNSVLGQTYAQRMFDVVVISDHQSELTNMKLAQLPITLLTPNFKNSSKAKSLQYAVMNLPQFKIYDAVVVLDAGNVVLPEFLEQVNNAYEMSGTKAMQVHRLSKNRDTTAARLDAIFEEINTSIFRSGHMAMGLSAGLNGSGIVLDFQWFKNNVMKLKPTLGEDKELESLLMRDSIFVDFFDNIHVYDEKTSNFKDFNKQRGRWIFTQLHSLMSNIRYLPSALFHKKYDHADKILQWMLIPRTILVGIIAIMAIVMPFIYFTLVIKWWVAAALMLLAFSFATPDYLVDEHWDHDFLSAPLILIWGFINIFTAGKKETEHRVSAAGKLLYKGKDTIQHRFKGRLPQKL